MLILCTDRYYFSLAINEKEAFYCECKNLFCECFNKIGVQIIAQEDQTWGGKEQFKLSRKGRNTYGCIGDAWVLRKNSRYYRD